MIYLKEPITDNIVKFENEDQIGAGFSDWEVLTQDEANDYELSQAKLDKIAQLKKNRDIANIAPMVSHQAKEMIFDEVEDDFIVTNNNVYFKFKLDPTGFSQTESTTICIAVIMTGAVNPAYYLRYSCEIIEGENLRKGYVAITPQVAGSIMTHGSNRITENTSICNDIESQINAIEIIENEDPEIAVTYEEALEALNKIDITF